MEAMPDETIIETSKRKTAMLLLGAIGFVALGIWMLTLDPEAIESLPRYKSPAFVYGAGIVSIVFFGLCGIVFIKRLSDTLPGLILNKDGFTDNSGGVSVGFVPWSEVAGIGEYSIKKQQFVSVYLNDPDKFASRGNLLQRKTNQVNINMAGTPITISANTLKTNHAKLLSDFEDYFSSYRKAD